MTITAQKLLSYEVHACVSSLVSTLAKHDGQSLDLPSNDELAHLTEQAYELAAPVEDYEEAAREAGWQFDDDNERWFLGQSETLDGSDIEYERAEDLCADNDIEPHYREVYEHWIVSDWLADRLIEKGEKVDKDFAGLIIWARTTTGQAIYCDHVIEQITAEVNKA
ncbi:hypothetical protein [Brucella sp. 10RB9210]|uniref:hypothetical protein n=1 Tax=Brucella sp. 10RB9210 TaxID=1844037 RepID=UPI0012ADDC5C|nr:hypothetical protein [Brucella sp. 10RB9210]MRN79441.1 hypothetical protein [Brucella sp. 10RB9210]